MKPPVRTLLFIAHGTRNPKGLDEARTFARLVGRRVNSGRHPSGAWQTSTAFLELAEPDMATGMERCAALGAEVVVLIPLFLFRAGHMKVDIPRAAEQFARTHPAIRVVMLDAVAFNDVFLGVVAHKVRSALGDGVKDTALLLLGRGNRDSEAQAIFERMGEQLRRDFPASQLFVGYLAGSGVAWRVALDDLARAGWRDIHIQPYLWFHGRLTDRLPLQVDEWRKRQPGVQNVRIGEPLGVEAPLVADVARRVSDALPEFETPPGLQEMKSI